jgi:hypothetical protein
LDGDIVAAFCLSFFLGRPYSFLFYRILAEYAFWFEFALCIMFSASRNWIICEPAGFAVVGPIVDANAEWDGCCKGVTSY